MTIHHAFCSDDLCWKLYATSYGRTAPAGPRLFRAPPHPDIAFAHEDEAAAKQDAETLQKYLDALPAPRKRKSADKSAYD